MRIAAAIAVLAVALSTALYLHQRKVTPGYVGDTSARSGSIYANNDNSYGQNSESIYATDGSIYAQGNDGAVGVSTHPSWEDPAALLVALGGLAVAVAVGPRLR